jgi:hypothetical protein
MIDPNLGSIVVLKLKMGYTNSVLKDEGNFLTSLAPLLNL